MTPALLFALAAVFVAVMAVAFHETSHRSPRRHGRHRLHLNHTGRIQHLMPQRRTR